MPQLTADSVAEFECWLDHHVTNWAVSDTLCGQLLSPLLQNGTLDVNRVHSWAGSASRWSRRALAVTLIPYIKAAPHLAASMMMQATVLLHDSEREVQQGLGWLLRECWKLDPQPVEKLLLKHKDTAPRLIYQYACEKMDKAAKERFKRGKPNQAGSAP
jgi:3-methyladenine DNA glycosylase AlkD